MRFSLAFTAALLSQIFVLSCSTESKKNSSSIVPQVEDEIYFGLWSVPTEATPKNVELQLKFESDTVTAIARCKGLSHVTTAVASAKAKVTASGIEVADRVEAMETVDDGIQKETCLSFVEKGKYTFRNHSENKIVFTVNGKDTVLTKVL